MAGIFTWLEASAVHSNARATRTFFLATKQQKLKPSTIICMK